MRSAAAPRPWIRFVATSRRCDGRVSCDVLRPHLARVHSIGRSPGTVSKFEREGGRIPLSSVRVRSSAVEESQVERAGSKELTSLELTVRASGSTGTATGGGAWHGWSESVRAWGRSRDVDVYWMRPRPCVIPMRPFPSEDADGSRHQCLGSPGPPSQPDSQRFVGERESRNLLPFIRGCLIGQSRSRLLSIGGSIGKRLPTLLGKNQFDRSRMAAKQLRPPCHFAPGPAKHCIRVTRNAARKCKVGDGEDALPQFPINVGMYHLVHKVTLEDRDANNAFVSFCCDLARKEGVERTLNVLRHPYGMDPCVAMLCMWMPIAGMEQPLGELQVAQIGKISNRWSGRLHCTLENARCQLEGESAGGEDSEQLRAEIGLLESKVILAEQRHLHETVKAAAFWSPGGSQEAMDPLSDLPWIVAAHNLRIYLRYMGLPHTPQIIRHIVDLNVACFDENFDQTEFVHTLSPNTVRPRTLEQDKKMFRYHMAKEAHKEAWEAYKEAQKELRRTRRISSIARHELYRTRKEVRQVWR